MLEIVDHHRIGDVQTRGPILFLNLPIGSTATIVALRYRELGVEIPEPIAGLLLSAVLTDTVLLKSPTTTDTDRRIVDELAQAVGVDPVDFGMEIFRSKLGDEPFDADKVVHTDLKEYRVGDRSVAIGQFETVDLGSVMNHADEVRASMAMLRERRDYDLVVLMVTDIVGEGSQVFADGATRLAERGLGVTLTEGSAWMPGVLSRKKQIAARLIEAAGTSK